MAKRKEPDTATAPEATATAHKRPRKSTHDKEKEIPESPPNGTTTPRRTTSTPVKAKLTSQKKGQNGEIEQTSSPTPKPNGRTLFTTPSKGKQQWQQTPSKVKAADRSAKRKSAQVLSEFPREDEIYDGMNLLARDILQTELEEAAAAAPSVEAETEAEAADPLVVGSTTPAPTPTPTPSRRGRPKGSKNKRSPTPEGDLPPEERYFFQNRAGPPQISSNTLASVELLTHDEYFEQIRKYRDGHEAEKTHLMKLHSRSFPQWKFEMSQGFNLCLYGYGSKRQLVNRFAEWLHAKCSPAPKIVVINGYTMKLNLRSILGTIGSTLVGEDEELRLAGQPQDMLDTLLSYLSQNPPTAQLMVMINSVDAAAMRRTSTQSLLARLAAHPLVNLVVTADTPTFPIMWNSTLLDQFNFAFHDCTTFAPYEVELSVVDEVHELLGRKGRRLGGKEGIGFVLKSLPENARNLYRMLLTEILAVLTDGIDEQPPLDYDEGAVDLDFGGRQNQQHQPRTNPSREPAVGAAMADEIGIEYRTLYQRASEEFICSSDMNFRFLLKEFHDHQMITSRRDAAGTELLGVPLGKEEMEAVLEDLGGG